MEAAFHSQMERASATIVHPLVVTRLLAAGTIRERGNDGRKREKERERQERILAIRRHALHLEMHLCAVTGNETPVRHHSRDVAPGQTCKIHPGTWAACERAAANRAALRALVIRITRVQVYRPLCRCGSFILSATWTVYPARARTVLYLSSLPGTSPSRN